MEGCFYRGRLKSITRKSPEASTEHIHRITLARCATGSRMKVRGWRLRSGGWPRCRFIGNHVHLLGRSKRLRRLRRPQESSAVLCAIRNSQPPGCDRPADASDSTA